MGQRYVSGAVVADGCGPTAERDPDLYYQPTTHPGSPLPHVWLERGTADISTLDLCGYDRFTLLTGAAGDVWADAARRVTRDIGVTIEPVAVGLGQPDNDVLGRWLRTRETSDRGCLLVRPDRVVAWRCPDHVPDPHGALRRTMAAILDH
jgi:2,4-dichlorophenol 6-monooxygenase